MSLLEEGKANTHLTHLEELVLTQGPDGYNMARAFLLELLETLKGNSKSHVQTSVKWDGAPAIFAGINPENGKFFVGTKSIFNKVPKINYTPQDIIDNHGHAPGLVDKLTKALKYLPALGIKNILQGDFMFDDEMLDITEIDGEPHYRFKPNTIVYAVPVDSDLGKEIGKSKFGIVFHTTYDSLDGGASFGADVSGLKRVPGIWFDDAFFTDDTGTVTLTFEEEKRVVELVTKADSVNKEIDYNDLPSDLLNIYINSEIKSGEFLQSPEKSFEGFMNWYSAKLKVKIDKLKSEKGRDRAHARGQEQLELFRSKQPSIIRLFEVSRLLFEAKNIFIAKYNNAVYNTKHFIDDGSGDLIASNPEGYVAVDHEGNGVKFVDRLEFSRANFMIDKGDKFTQNESHMLKVVWEKDQSTTASLVEWAASLPSTTKTNQRIFEQIKAGIPVTCLISDGNRVKQLLAEAVNWAITTQEGMVDQAKAVAKITKAAAGAGVPATKGGIASQLESLKNVLSINEQEGKYVVLIPGGFKPPHKGHYAMLNHYAENPDVQDVVILNGPKAREGVTQEMSQQLFDLYGGLDPKIQFVEHSLPMRAAFELLGDEKFVSQFGDNVTFVLGCSQKVSAKGPSDAARATQFAEWFQANPDKNPLNVNVGVLSPCPVESDGGIDLSASVMRKAARESNDKLLSLHLPKDVDVNAVKSILPSALEEFAMAGGGIAGAPGKALAPVKKSFGSKERKDEMVNEVMDYLLGISVG